MLERVRASSIEDIVVVLGAHEVESSVRTVHCPDWRRGRGASLRCGLNALGDETQAAVIVLVDGPDLSPAAIDRVLEVWHESGGEVVAATYEGDRGHPVVLSRGVWGRIPEEGARSLPAVLVPCDDLGAPGDVDVPEDLPERFRR